MPPFSWLASGLGVEHAAHVEGADPARHPDLAGVTVDMHLAEVGAGRRPNPASLVSQRPGEEAHLPGHGPHTRVRADRDLDVVVPGACQGGGEGLTVPAAPAAHSAADLGRRVRDAPCDTGRLRRTARSGRDRQVGVAVLDAHGVVRDAELVRDDLRLHRGGAHAHLVEPAPQESGAVRVEPQGEVGDEDPGGVVRQGHSVPDQRRAGMRRLPFVPTELASPEVHDLADPAVRVRPAVHRGDGRLVAEPQVDGVDPEVVRELVHRGLHGERAHRLTGGPHGGVGDEVELDDRRSERDGRCVVELTGRADHLVRAAAHRRGPHDRLVEEGRQTTVRGGAESDPLGGRRPAAHGPVNPFAGQRHPHGTPGGAGGHDRQQRSRPHEALAAEPAADEGRQHADLLQPARRTAARGACGTSRCSARRPRR